MPVTMIGVPLLQLRAVTLLALVLLLSLMKLGKEGLVGVGVSPLR
jgi:hypothetical protein